MEYEEIIREIKKVNFFNLLFSVLNIKIKFVIYIKKIRKNKLFKVKCVLKMT